jgi:glycosyltransferase involved in cell wall biosynthesis
MKVGLVLTSSDKMASVKHVMATVRDALAEHELIFPHPSISWAPEEEQLRVAAEFVEQCDAIVGLLHPAILEMRQRLGGRVPYLFLMLGIMPRGAFGLRKYLRQMSTNDSLIVSSSADRGMCENFFDNAHVPVIPLAYDDRFYFPLPAEDRSRIRSELGLDDQARVVLYAGRMTPEKNIHSVLRVFGALSELLPDLYLVLAGRIVPVAFKEFGVSPVAFPRTLAAATERMVRQPERVLFAGAVPAQELREFYNVADLGINLTLHHDENFGLAQVEAMACGLPMVGSCWGGLKDTIVEGSTGFHVSTQATPTGVKLSWWEAVCRGYEILRDPAFRRRFRDETPAVAADRFSVERLRERLGELVRSRVELASRRAPEPIEVTAFAREFWEVCEPTSDLRPSFRRGPHSLRLYRRMIEPYTGRSPLGVAPDEPPLSEDVLSLAVPVRADAAGVLWPDDPLFPLPCEVPPELARGVTSLLAAFRTRPVARADTLGPNVSETLDWMLAAGLLLRSRGPELGIPHDAIPKRLAEPVFSFQHLPPDGVDFLVSS